MFVCMRARFFLAAAGLAMCAAPCLRGAGVPRIDPDYTSTVEVWWETHPFNPKNKRPDIEVMRPVVAVASGGSIQAAIDALPAGGGTIELEPGGTYEMFKIVGRSNVHIVGRRTDPAKPLGDGERPKIVGGLVSDPATGNWAGHIAVGELALDYGPFDRMTSRANDPDHEAARELLKNPARNFFFRDLEFNGGGKSGNALQLQRVRDVVFENCRFAEYVDRTSTHGALVNGHMGLTNIWFFDCDFVGSARFAIYLDGAHGSGAIGCRFAGRNDAAMEGFTSGCVLNLTNDDFTEDIDDSGTIDRPEERNAKYNVYMNNTMGPVYQGFAMTGENILIKNNTIEGKAVRFAFFDARSASTNFPLWDANGNDHRYEYENLRVEDNTVTDSCSEAFVVIYHSANEIGEVHAGESTPRMGRWVVKGNQVGSAPMLIKAGGRNPPVPFTEPNVVEGNSGSFAE